MSAVNIFTDARAAGIQIRVERDDLVLEASAPPSPALLELLARHKPEILVWLRPGGWSSEDWQAFYNERAAITDFDGGRD